MYITLARSMCKFWEIPGQDDLYSIGVLKILGPRGPDPLLLYSTKQWSVAMGVVNKISIPRRKEQKKRHKILSALLPTNGPEV